MKLFQIQWTILPFSIIIHHDQKETRYYYGCIRIIADIIPHNIIKLLIGQLTLIKLVQITMRLTQILCPNNAY